MNLPLHWGKTTLGESCDFLNGKAHEQNIDKNGDFIVVNSKFIASEGAVNKKTNSALFPLFKNDIAMVISDVPKGRALAKCYLIEEDNKYSLNQRICVIRSTKFDFKFLFYQLNRNQYFLQFDDGDSQTNLRKEDILNCPLYLPPIAEQKRIAAILDKADAIRRKRQEAIKLTEEFARSLFLDMFGDPVTNPKNWSVDLFGNVGKLDRGKSKHRPRNEPSLLGGKHPLIQTGDVANCKGIIKSYTQTYSDKGLAQSKMWPSGTLCITIAANIAETGILGFDACFPDSIVGFIPSLQVTTEYIQGWLEFLQPILEANAPQSAQKNINLDILRNLKLPIPPIEKQKKYSSLVQFLRSSITKNEQDKNYLENLFNSLLQRAFKGEL
ncbi:MAG: restriction endonuclease subunit S [Snowella sp.]|nr:restriction endonuclease subunit S [Snowella sp.]